MTYYDVHGRVGQGPTSQGLRDLREWAQSFPATKLFLDAGETEDLETVASEMGRATTLDPDLEEIRVALLAAASTADTLLIVSE